MFEGIINRGVQAIFFSGASFFSWPWKPLLCFLYGDTYRVGYQHFRRDHHTALNLVAHLIALVVQLAGNFGLLANLDGIYFPSRRYLSNGTAVLWIASLAMQHESPLIVRLCSTLSIVAALRWATFVSATTIELGAISGFLLLFSLGELQGLEGKGGRVQPWKSVPKIALIFGSWLLIWQPSYPLAGALRDNVALVVKFLVPALFASSALSQPTIPSVIVGGFGCRIAYHLTQNSAFLYFSLGFFGSLCQAVSHGISRESATLPQLEKLRVSEKLGYQLSHMHYFPSLLFQSCYESLMGTP